jgi:hypothetical protein
MIDPTIVKEILYDTEYKADYVRYICTYIYIYIYGFQDIGRMHWRGKGTGSPLDPGALSSGIPPSAMMRKIAWVRGSNARKKLLI